MERLVGSGQSARAGGIGAAGVEQSIEGGAANAEHARGAELVAFDAGQDEVDVTQDGAVEVGVIFGGYRDECLGDIDGPNPLAFAFEGRVVDDALELADIARPGMGVEVRQGQGGQGRGQACRASRKNVARRKWPAGQGRRGARAAVEWRSEWR